MGVGRSFHWPGTVKENVLESDFEPLCDGITRRRSCWTRNCPACSKIEGGFKSQSIGVYSTRNHQSTDLGCLRQSVVQRTNPRYIPTASFIVGVHVPPSSLGEGGPPLDPPIRYHFFVSFFCKTDNPTQAKRPLSPPPRLLTPTHTYPSTLLDSLI